MGNIWMVLQQTAAASLVAVFILILQRLFQDKLSPKWQYTIWLVLLVRLLIPAGWGAGNKLDVSGWLDCIRIWTELLLDSAWTEIWAGERPVAGIPLLLGGAPRSVTDWLFVLYLAGVLACALWLLLGWRKLSRTVNRAVPVAGERLEQVRAIAGQFGLKPPVRMVESQQVRGPFLMGVLHPTLAVPMGWQVDEKVVLHELLHRKNQDVAAGWITALFRCIHWCNPFLWWIFDRIDNQREQRCDQQVLERLEGEDRRDYGRVLLSMAEEQGLRVPGATTLANGAAHIKARIQSIARFKTFPQGMGLVSVCMTLILLPNLVLGFSPALVNGQTQNAPEWAAWFGNVGQLAYSMTNRATTVAGALDAYGKSAYQQWYSPSRYFGYLAMVTPKEELPALWQKWKQGWSESEREAHLMSGDLYRTGPMFRGLAPDGEGGYWTQMYFFRDEMASAGGGKQWSIGYQRHTLWVQPQEDGTWTVRELSASTGQLAGNFQDGMELDHLDRLTIPLPEPPIFSWAGEVDGVRVELWPEANVRVQDAYLNGSAAMTDFLSLNDFGRSILTDTPDLDALFTSVEGTMSGRLTNLTGQSKQFTLDTDMYWSSGTQTFWNSSSSPFDSLYGNYQPLQESYAGYDLNGYQVELGPGESVPVYYGGRGRGLDNRVPVECCVLPDGLYLSYTDGQGNAQSVFLEREVNLE